MDPLALLLSFDSASPWRLEPPTGIGNRLAPFDRARSSARAEGGIVVPDEAIALAQLAGAIVLRDDAIAFLGAETAPTTRNERLLANASRTLRRVIGSASECLDHELLAGIHRGLFQRIDRDDFVGRLRRERERPHGDEIAGVRSGGVADPAAWVERMCAMANARVGERPYLHPVLKALVIHAAVAVAAPFPSGNASVARLLLLRQLIRDGYGEFESSPVFSAFLFAPDRVTYGLEDALLRHDVEPALSAGLEVLDRAIQIARARR